MKKVIPLLSIGIICSTILLFLKFNKNNLIFVFTKFIPPPTIVYGNFSCETWKNFSYINHSKYQECLSWGVDGSFWSVEGLRHTAHKHLLNSSSLVVEVGGNRGHDTVKFIEFHNLSIISYEPLVQMWKSLTEQFKSNPKIQIHPYGLGNHARSLLIEPNDYGNAGTSIFRPLSSPNSSLIERIQLLNIVEVIQNIRKTRTKTGIIDMISINCEGCEFEIIPALILNNLTQYFRIIQFATHLSLVSQSSCIYCQIEQALQQTHQILYHYTKLWEGWVPMILVRNKCDLEDERVVGKEVGQTSARNWNSTFLETSAKQKVNVNEIFFDLVRQINKRTPVNKDKKNKGKNFGNTNSTSTSGKSPIEGSQNPNGNKQDCCVLL